LIDLLVVGDRVCAQIIIAFKQTFDRSLEAAFRQTSHHQNVISQRSERFVKGSENMSWGNH
jgi:hypothetical protein